MAGRVGQVQWALLAGNRSCSNANRSCSWNGVVSRKNAHAGVAWSGKRAETIAKAVSADGGGGEGNGGERFGRGGGNGDNGGNNGGGSGGSGSFDGDGVQPQAASGFLAWYPFACHCIPCMYLSLSA